MSGIPVPDERTHYSSRRQDDADALAWPVFSGNAVDLLRSAGEVLRPEPGELLWETGETYDLYRVLAGGVLLLDRRDGFATSVPGVFAAGDVRAGSVKRVASAAGEGSVVISAVHSYLASAPARSPGRAGRSGTQQEM